MIDTSTINKSLWPETCHGRWMSPEYEPGLVSVIIPTYNRAHFLVEAMDSVWNQTYRPIELIVVDDGSTDNTQEVLHDWARKSAADDQFRLRSFHQENKGAPTARNLGLIESHGEYIQFLDSDDLLAPSKIKVQVAALRGTQGAMAVYGPRRMFWPISNLLYVSRAGIAEQEVKSLDDAMRGWATGIHSILWARRDVYQLGPWDEQLAANQDGDYKVRFLLRGGGIPAHPPAVGALWA